MSKSTLINIATPAYRSNYSSEYVKTIFALLGRKKDDLSFYFSDIDYSDIAVARNYLISNFYYKHTDCSYILFIDSDMGFSSELLYKMIALREDVVGAISPYRAIDLRSLHANKSNIFSNAYANSLSFIGKPGLSHNKDKSFRRVEKIGAGILLISRRCIEIMIDACPDIKDSVRFKKLPFGADLVGFITPFDKIKLPDKELSEDFSFCYRWTNICKREIYANIDTDIEHVSRLCIRVKWSDTNI